MIVINDIIIINSMYMIHVRQSKANYTDVRILEVHGGFCFRFCQIEQLINILNICKCYLKKK